MKDKYQVEYSEESEAHAVAKSNESILKLVIVVVLAFVVVFYA